MDPGPTPDPTVGYSGAGFFVSGFQPHLRNY